MKTYYFMTFGCKVNRYDGQQIVEELDRAGWIATREAATADVVVVNCCVVTGRSAGRCRRAVRGLIRRNRCAPIVVTGCLTEDDARAMRELDARVETAQPGCGLQLVRNTLATSPCDGSNEGVRGLKDRTRAYVKVQDGCDLCCTYCVIPSIRGTSRSRPAEEVLDEVGRLIAGGYRELVLCGIRLGGYRHDGLRLDGLLAKILEKEQGTLRIRLSSLNPAEVTEDLLDVMARDGRVARHLHLPLQSGDDRTLRRMARPYRAESYLRKLELVREFLWMPAISTDFMVGFPGEDEEAFTQSLEVLRASGAARVHVFPYSQRPGTPAAALPQVQDAVKTERAGQTRRLAAALKESYDRAFIGTEATILLEGRHSPAGRGLTSRYQEVDLLPALPSSRDNQASPARKGSGDLELEPGRFIRVRLEEYEEGRFSGSIVARRADGQER